MTHLSLPILEIPAARRSRPLALLSGPIASVAAPVALGLALQVNYGQFHPLALRWLTLSLLACIATLFHLGRRKGSEAGSSDMRMLVTVASAGLVVQFLLLLTSSPIASHAFRYESELLPFRSCIALAAVCAAAALLSRRPRHPALFAMLALHFVAGLWVLRVTPPPPVDVCLFQRDACAALFAGHNPYALTFPLPYNDPARVYAPGSFANGRLLFGYPYPPLSLLLVLPGYLFGDFRYALLAATTLAGALIALARPSRIATAAAALFLFTPRGFFVLEAGWTEPLVVLLLAAVVFALCRGLRAAPILFGLLLVTKQYLVLAAPLALFLRRGTGGPPVSSIKEKTRTGRPCHAPQTSRIPTSRLAWIVAILLPLLISLPLILRNIPAFMHSAVLLQFHQPMRMDALSYAPWILSQTGLHLPMWLPFLAAAGAIAFALRQRSRTPTALAAGVALAFFLFFALNKQAFCNYYFFVIGAMCCSLATCGGPSVTDNSAV
jgi:hypothetical protein